MLKYLHIENIAVIEQSNIDFTDGFNVLTGETGAGKSIIIDSLNAVLGERASRELIRNGCDTARVSAVFGELNNSAENALVENGYSADEDGNVIIERTLSLTGKGMIKINGQPVTAGLLREIGKELVNIHGQHDNQSLLNPESHSDYIDKLADNQNILSEYYNEFKNFKSIRKELLELETDQDEKQRKLELLKYQITELEAADIKTGEISDLKYKAEIAGGFEKNIKLFNDIHYLLSGDDDNDGSIVNLNRVRDAFHNIELSQTDDCLEKTEQAIEILRDISYTVRSFIDNSEYSSLNSDEIQERLDFLHKLMLKYGNDEEEMLEFLRNAKADYEKIIFSDEKIEKLGAMLEKSSDKLVDLGDKLTNVRKKATDIFCNEVCEVLKYLDMPSVKFVVDFQKGKYTKNGCDIIEFMISANKGENIKPLIKIASGGELSRVMLAIKSVISDKDSVNTLIFDEIDSGISGRAAEKVGLQLKKLSAAKQVICVTHLSQIAVNAGNHLLIEKSTKNDKTFTMVTTLDYNSRINEIARIMSGSEITDNLFNSAKELLDRHN